MLDTASHDLLDSHATHGQQKDTLHVVGETSSFPQFPVTDVLVVRVSLKKLMSSSATLNNNNNISWHAGGYR